MVKSEYSQLSDHESNAKLRASTKRNSRTSIVKSEKLAESPSPSLRKVKRKPRKSALKVEDDRDDVGKSIKLENPKSEKSKLPSAMKKEYSSDQVKTK